jgi:hypothetical protein
MKVRKYGFMVWSRKPSLWEKCVVSFTHPTYGDCRTSFRIAR